MDQEPLQAPEFPINQQENSPQSQFSEHTNQYLANIPDEHRSIVGKYVGEWDKGVTQKFQDYSGRLKGYEELGDVGTLASARQIYEALDEDPRGFLTQLQEYLDENMPEDTVSDDLEFEEEEYDPEDWKQRYEELQHQHATLEERFEGFESSQQEAEQMKMLDSVLEDMHNTHGDFNDRWILLEIANGASPEEAIESWNGLQQNIVDSRKSNPPPPLMGGPGGTPLDQVDRSALRDPKTRKEFGAALLKAQLGG